MLGTICFFVVWEWYGYVCVGSLWCVDVLIVSIHPRFVSRSISRRHVVTSSTIGVCAILNHRLYYTLVCHGCSRGVDSPTHRCVVSAWLPTIEDNNQFIQFIVWAATLHTVGRRIPWQAWQRSLSNPRSGPSHGRRLKRLWKGSTTSFRTWTKPLKTAFLF